jgi:integrase
VGSHGNVGGGSYDDLLSQLPLRWLMSKAEKHGLAFRQALDIDEEAPAGEIDDSFKAFLKGAYSLLHAEQRYWRPIGRPPEARMHTVVHTINETIDASVFERWRMGSGTVQGTWPIGQKSTRSRLRTSPGHAWLRPRRNLPQTDSGSHQQLRTSPRATAIEYLKMLFRRRSVIRRVDAWRMIQRCAADLGMRIKIGCHTFRATGITAYLESGGTLENAQAMAAHESPRTTKLYDRTGDEITLDEVERITI